MTVEFLARATSREIMSLLSPEHATDEHSLVCFDVLGADRDGLYRFSCSCGEAPVLLAPEIQDRTGRLPGTVADRLSQLGRRANPA
jgi:hypothetical protein